MGFSRVRIARWSLPPPPGGSTPARFCCYLQHFCIGPVISSRRDARSVHFCLKNTILLNTRMVHWPSEPLGPQASTNDPKWPFKWPPNDPPNDTPNDPPGPPNEYYATKFTPQNLQHEIYTTKCTPQHLHHEIYTTTLTPQNNSKFTPRNLHHTIYTEIYTTKFTPDLHHKVYNTKFTPRMSHHEIYTTTSKCTTKCTPRNLHHEIYTTTCTEFTAVWGLTLES